MFTGIVKDVGKIVSIVKRGEGLRFGVETHSADFADLAIDESVAINGTCQTVVAITGHTFEVDTVEETLKKTTLRGYKVGTRVNLERALRPTDRMGGHIVQGHVDCVGTILSIEKQSASWKYNIRYDSKFDALIIPIGSIAVDGISLTVADVSLSVFTLAIIPYTFAHTTLAERMPGDCVNLEFDILGKYVARQLRLTPNTLPHTTLDASGLTESRLKELGY